MCPITFGKRLRLNHRTYPSHSFHKYFVCPLNLQIKSSILQVSYNMKLITISHHIVFHTVRGFLQYVPLLRTYPSQTSIASISDKRPDSAHLSIALTL